MTKREQEKRNARLQTIRDHALAIQGHIDANLHNNTQVDLLKVEVHMDTMRSQLDRVQADDDAEGDSNG